MVTAGLFADSAKNKIYWVQGPEALTLDEVRDRFLQNFTKINLRVRSAPLWLLKVIGWFDSEVAYTARIMDSIVHFPEPFQGEAAWRELHRPTETVSSFAKRVSLEN
jgi:uncharacterized protein YgiM (DUF1202 family)